MSLALFLVIVLAGSTLVLLQSNYHATRLSADGDRQRQLLAADNGAAKFKAALVRDPGAWDTHLQPDPLDPSHLVLDEDDARVYVQLLDQTGDVRTLLVRSIGRYAGGSREIELVFRARPGVAKALVTPALGAIVADNDVRLTGTIVVDGNDHDREGQPLAGVDRFGVDTTGAVDLASGAVTVGGSGEPPSKVAGASDGLHFDAQSTTWDTEAANGVDDDGDGIVDEDGFFERPGQFLGLSQQELEDAARSSGTLFTSKADYESWLASGAARGGVVIYLQIDAPPGPLDLGSFELPHNPAPANAPSVVVVGRKPDAMGNVDHDVTIGPVHAEGGNGTFQGVLIADDIQATNGTIDVIGSVVAFNPNGSMSLGNGSARVLHSSQVLGALPSLAGSPQVEALMWREVR